MVTKGGFMRRHYTWLTLGQRLIDALVPPIVLWALTMAYSIPWKHEYAVLAILSGLLVLVVMEVVDTYRPWRGSSLWSEATVIVSGWLMIAMLLLGYVFVTKTSSIYSRVVVLGWFVVAPMGMVLLHMFSREFLRLLRRRGRNSRRALIVGAGQLGRNLASQISSAHWMGMDVIGFFDDGYEKGDVLNGFLVLGSCDDVVQYLSMDHVDVVYVALPMRAESRMRELFAELQDTTASVYLVPDIFMFDLMGSRMQDIGGMPVFALCETPFSGPFGMVKRIEDLILSSVATVLLLPVMVIVAMGVKLTSRGPVIFKQRRYGLNGKSIRVYKFRTMTVCEDGEDFVQAKRGDSRVTRFGAFLRKTSLDELPQLYNVLQGRMSLVGPRPHPLALNEQYRKLVKAYMWRHKVKPGITGLAQVNGWRGETDTLEKMEKRIEYDIEYIRHWSIWLDIKILALTVIKGFIGKNAY